MSKEDVYDEQINPLMARIIAICKEHDIPLVADFQLDDDRDACDPEDTFHCTTYVVPDNASPRLHAAKRAVQPLPPVLMAIAKMRGHEVDDD